MLVGLQLRVVLHDRQHLLQGRHQLVLIHRLLLGPALAGHALGPQLRDALEDLLLVGRIALDGRHEIGDQIVAAFELRIDVAPGVADVVAQGHQRVVRHDDVDQRHQKDDPETRTSSWHHHLTSRRTGIRHQRPQGDEPVQVRLDPLGVQPGVERDRQHVVLDLDGQVVVGQQILHHPGVADVVGELLVRRAHAELAGELVRLEIDVVVADRLGDLREEPFPARSPVPGRTPAGAG